MYTYNTCILGVGAGGSVTELGMYSMLAISGISQDLLAYVYCQQAFQVQDDVI
jgi:hypothetical protein